MGPACEGPRGRASRLISRNMHPRRASSASVAEGFGRLMCLAKGRACDSHPVDKSQPAAHRPGDHVWARGRAVCSLPDAGAGHCGFCGGLRILGRPFVLLAFEWRSRVLLTEERRFKMEAFTAAIAKSAAEQITWLEQKAARLKNELCEERSRPGRPSGTTELPRFSPPRFPSVC
ncbi:unnamed protein product [Amoebophrya sp. A120]|nr:unnamed protein product [Amoebophrya sp. A120]|eukprot:GSA120T00025558001.1